MFPRQGLFAFSLALFNCVGFSVGLKCHTSNDKPLISSTSVISSSALFPETCPTPPEGDVACCATIGLLENNQWKFIIGCNTIKKAGDTNSHQETCIHNPELLNNKYILKCYKDMCNDKDVKVECDKEKKNLEVYINQKQILEKEREVKKEDEAKIVREVKILQEMEETLEKEEKKHVPIVVPAKHQRKMNKPSNLTELRKLVQKQFIKQKMEINIETLEAKHVQKKPVKPKSYTTKERKSEDPDEKHKSENPDKKHKSENPDKKHKSENPDEKNKSGNPDEKNKTGKPDKKDKTGNPDDEPTNEPTNQFQLMRKWKLLKSEGYKESWLHFLKKEMAKKT